MSEDAMQWAAIAVLALCWSVSVFANLKAVDLIYRLDRVVALYFESIGLKKGQGK